MSNRAVFVVLLLAVAAVAIPLGISHTVPPPSASVDLKRFSSYADLLSFIQSNTAVAQGWNKGGIVFTSPPTSALAGSAAAEVQTNTPSYSTTNIQVAGVDEADIVKTDGSYIYVARGTLHSRSGEVDILKAYPPSSAQVVSRLTWSQGKTVTSLLLNGDRLVVFLYSYDSSAKNAYSPKAEMDVFDVRDRANPVLVRNLTVDGQFADSRMIGSYVYAVTTSWAYVVEGQVKLPTISTVSEARDVQPSDVFYSNTTDAAYSFTTLVSFNVQNDLLPYFTKTILMGATSVIYVSTDNIYLAIAHYGSIATATSGGITTSIMPLPTSEDTLIYRVRVWEGSMEADAQGSVPGALLNQFSLDEYKGYLRVATTSGSFSWGASTSSQSNNVYVLNGSLSIVGKIEGMAPGEKIYSTRFLGDRAYIVTFKKVDPFFVIDLKDPSSPQVLGWLKTPGFSNYLQPLDENHVIGIGKDAADAETGNFAWYQGLKISLFDVTNVTNPIETSKFLIGDRGTDSPALYDHHALLLDTSMSLMVIPVTVAKVDPSKYPTPIPSSAYGDAVWQGAYVFNVSPEKGIALNETVTHLSGNITQSSADYSLYIQRSLYIGSYLYTISDGMVKVNNLQGLATVQTIKLP